MCNALVTQYNILVFVFHILLYLYCTWTFDSGSCCFFTTNMFREYLVYNGVKEVSKKTW